VRRGQEIWNVSDSVSLPCKVIGQFPARRPVRTPAPSTFQPSVSRNTFCSRLAANLVIEPNDNRRTWLVCSVLVLVTLAIYWPVRHYDFVEYDDPDYVSENQTIRSGITPYSLMWSFVDAHTANWLPVTCVAHMLDCQLFGVNPGAHHMVNVALHCANSALLFLLLRMLTGAFWRSAFVAALFAWHPLRVESVAWISELKDVLSGFFFMLTLLAYGRYAKSHISGSRFQVPSPRSQVPSGRRRFSISSFQFPVLGSLAGGRASSGLNSPSPLYLLSIILFAVGLLSKPMLVTVPFVLLLLDFWPLERFGENSSNACLFGFPRRLLFEKAPFLLLSSAVALITFFAQRSGGAVVSLESDGLATRAGNTLTGYVSYLEKVVWPHDLAFLYLRPHSFSIPVVLCAITVLVAISYVALVKATTRPYLAVGWLWFVGMMLPVSGLLQTGLQSIADRYTYLPAIGLAIMAVWGLRELVASLFAGRAAQVGLAATGVACLCICAGTTGHQLAYWQNTETLMEHALLVDPNNYVAHQNLGVYYSKLGLTETAREHRQRVRELELLAQDGLSRVAQRGISRPGGESLQKGTSVNE